jgi:hypothetical protein
LNVGRQLLLSERDHVISRLLAAVDLCGLWLVCGGRRRGAQIRADSDRSRRTATNSVAALASRSATVARSESAAAWAGAVGLGCFAWNLFISRPLVSDSFLDIDAGRVVARSGIPHHEVFTLAAAGRPWIDQQWLAHLLYYGAWSLGGYAGLAIVSSLLIALAFGLLAGLMTWLGVPVQRAAAWTLLAFVACLGNTIVRAQSFSFALFVALLWLLVADSGRDAFRRKFLLILPLLALWSNLHGAVVLGIALTVAYALVRAGIAAVHRDLRSALGYSSTAAITPLMLFANPYGVSVLGYYHSLLGRPVLASGVTEWARPSITSALSWGFFMVLALTVAAVGYGALRGARPPWVLVLVTAPLLLAAGQGVRYQAWFAVSGALLTAVTLARVRPAPPPLAPLALKLGGVLIVVFAASALVVVSRAQTARFETLTAREAVTAAAAYAENHPRARILGDDLSSALLLWNFPRLHQRVGFDIRLEQYSDRQLRRWFTYQRGTAPNWLATTRGYDVLVATESRTPSLVARLRALQGWRVLRDDDSGIALARVTPRP